MTDYRCEQCGGSFSLPLSWAMLGVTCTDHRPVPIRERMTLKSCICGQCVWCPDGYHGTDENCGCTADCAHTNDSTCPCGACGTETP